MQAERSPTRCPFCRDELLDTKHLVACAACGARHHEGCHREHGACAACGSSEALYPRSQARAAAGRPPAGSRLEVECDGDRTTYRWRLGTPGDWGLLVLLSVLLMPLAPVLLLFGYLRTRKHEELVLHPDAIELPVLNNWKRRVRIAREDVGAVKVHPGGAGGWVLSIDSGIERHMLAGDRLTNRSLTGPELDFLAERIAAWKARG